MFFLISTFSPFLYSSFQAFSFLLWPAFLMTTFLDFCLWTPRLWPCWLSTLASLPSPLPVLDSLGPTAGRRVPGARRNARSRLGYPGL